MSVTAVIETDGSRLTPDDRWGVIANLDRAPIPEIPERALRDLATGIVVLDETGIDRVQVGKVGNPMVGGKVQSRIADAVGLMICDPKGNERAGFGYLENSQVGQGLDYEGGEAVVAAVLPEQGMAGIVINAPVEGDHPTRAMLIKRVYEVDPLCCPECGGQMKVVSFIEPPQADVIEHILRHCGLWQSATPRAPPEVDPLVLELDAAFADSSLESPDQTDQSRELTYVDIDTFLASF